MNFLDYQTAQVIIALSLGTILFNIFVYRKYKYNKVIKYTNFSMIFIALVLIITMSSHLVDLDKIKKEELRAQKSHK